MPEPEIGPKSRAVGLRIHDLIGLVIGYGLAAILIRFFLYGPRPMTIGLAAALTLVYLWAGLAMSGPFILLLDGRGPPDPATTPGYDRPTRFTGEEIAWIGIGLYFAALTVLISPARGHETLDGKILAFQVFVGLVLLICLWAVNRNRPTERVPAPRWTRRAAAFMLATWPAAWILAIWLSS